MVKEELKDRDGGNYESSQAPEEEEYHVQGFISKAATMAARQAEEGKKTEKSVAVEHRHR